MAYIMHRKLECNSDFTYSNNIMPPFEDRTWTGVVEGKVRDCLFNDLEDYFGVTKNLNKKYLNRDILYCRKEYFINTEAADSRRAAAPLDMCMKDEQRWENDLNKFVKELLDYSFNYKDKSETLSQSINCSDSTIIKQKPEFTKRRYRTMLLLSQLGEAMLARFSDQWDEEKEKVEQCQFQNKINIYNNDNNNLVTDRESMIATFALSKLSSVKMLFPNVKISSFQYCSQHRITNKLHISLNTPVEQILNYIVLGCIGLSTRCTPRRSVNVMNWVPKLIHTILNPTTNSILNRKHCSHEGNGQPYFTEPIKQHQPNTLNSAKLNRNRTICNTSRSVPFLHINNSLPRSDPPTFRAQSSLENEEVTKVCEPKTMGTLLQQSHPQNRVNSNRVFTQGSNSHLTNTYRFPTPQRAQSLFRTSFQLKNPSFSRKPNVLQKSPEYAHCTKMQSVQPRQNLPGNSKPTVCHPMHTPVKHPPRPMPGRSFKSQGEPLHYITKRSGTYPKHQFRIEQNKPDLLRGKTYPKIKQSPLLNAPKSGLGMNLQHSNTPRTATELSKYFTANQNFIYEDDAKHINLKKTGQCVAKMPHVSVQKHTPTATNETARNTFGFLRPVTEHAANLARQYAAELQAVLGPRDVEVSKDVIKKAVHALKTDTIKPGSEISVDKILLNLSKNIRGGANVLKFVISLVRYGCWSGVYVTNFLTNVINLLE